ncbi:MAG: hypothetical protein NVS9B13_10100 [Candidatus Acidiferrum sp.]
MDRTFWGTILGGLLGLSSLGAVAFVGGSADSCAGPPPPPKFEGDWRLLEPVTYENITIFPVVSASSHDTSAFLTLEEGLSSGEVLVREQGGEGLARNREGRPVIEPDYRTGPSVNQLVLINRSKRPLLLLAGELVSGGKQDRIIAKDRIVAPGGPALPLDVFCVEHGRWSSGSQFNAAKTIVHPSVREYAALNQDQELVWDAVVTGSTAAPPIGSAPTSAGTPRLNRQAIGNIIGSAAPTQSYAKIYQESKAGASVDEFVDEVQRRFAEATHGLKGERVVGVVVAYGGEVAWSDIFASGELFNHYWTKLLRSYAVEAMARPTLRKVADHGDAREFLQRLNGRERQESEPGVYLWREITEGRRSQIELEALQPKPMTLHRLLLHRTS